MSEEKSNNAKGAETMSDKHHGKGDSEEKEKQIQNSKATKTEEAKNDGDEGAGGDNAIPLVLEPDHPMMQRFQAALKAHLQRQIEKVSGQVFELEYEIKQKEKEKEATGLDLYTVQEEVYRQQKILENCESTIESLMKERESLDESVKSKKSSWKEEVNQLNCAKKKEMELTAELQRLSSLAKQMEKWEKEMEMELAVSQRISEKTMHQKNKLIQEKREMDMYLLKLMTTVSGYEAEIIQLDTEIDLKMEDKDSLNQTIADAAADLQALVAEQKRLMTAWNGVATMINQKNAIYAGLSQELTKCQDTFRSLNAEIESYKRSCADEMKKSEKLAILYGRVESDYESGEHVLKNLLEKKTVLEEKIASTSIMIDRTDAELLNIKIQKDKIEGGLNGIRAAVEKLCQEHRRLEDEAMNCMQEQSFNDKAASHLNKLLKESREKNRKQEFSLLETENKISQKFLQAEELKEVISRNNEIVREANKELKNKEEELKSIENEIEKCHVSLVQKQGNYATLTRKIEKCQEKTNFGKTWLSPTQQRINDLEKMNAEIQAKNDKMQGFWLIQQNNNVKLTQRRSELLKEISLLRKQVLLFEQRVLKTDREFQKEKKIESDVNRAIAQLQHKLMGLNELLVGRKGYKENLGKENSLVQAQYLQNLKESELEQIRLKDEIKEAESNLEELAETMLATQREMLAWERKIQSAVEAKNDMQKQRSSSGEIGQMKAEIHRMEVRYGQLRRAQEKLISDLEQCVYRRDAMLDGVEAMEKRQNRSATTRIAFQKKLEALRNNIKAVKSERRELQKVIDNTREGHADLRKCILQKEACIAEMNETTKKMDLQLENGRLQKCQNLELLIRRQKKCKMYDLLKNGKHRMLFKSDATLENEIQKTKCKNANLVSVMEALIEDFPGYRFHLTKIYNTFNAKPS